MTSDAAAYDMYGNRLEGADHLVDERPVYVVGAGDPEALFKNRRGQVRRAKLG